MRTTVLHVLGTFFVLASVPATGVEPQRSSTPAPAAPVRVGRYPEDLHSQDPSLRAGALSRLMNAHWDVDKPHVEQISTFLHDPENRPRATAVLLLSRILDPSVVPLLQDVAKQDSDAYVRAVATVGLIRNGQLPPIAELKRLMENYYGDYPFGPVSAGVVVSRRVLIDVFASQADSELFKLCLQYPPECEFTDADQTYARLGESLRKRPEAATVLLAARDDSQLDTKRSDFAKKVFRGAGLRMLPRLHEALRSEDGIVRSNAARACGAVGDRSSIPHLVKALDLEHFGARRAIVLALGELKSRDSLPLLVKVYSQAREEEERNREQRERELREAGPVGYLPPKKHHPWPHFGDSDGDAVIWDPWAILDAIHAIGPELSQQFYRDLVTDSNVRSRNEAALRMAECEPADAKLNEPGLRSLLTDKDERLRMEAAISLLVLGHQDVQQTIIAWIESDKAYNRYWITSRLNRVKDAKKLAFARTALERLVNAPSETGDCRDFARWLLKRIAGGS